MKHLFTLSFLVASLAAFAQQPSYVGTDISDGITYSEYQLLDHGVVSSYRVFAQNTIADSSLEWNFIAASTGDRIQPVKFIRVSTQLLTLSLKTLPPDIIQVSEAKHAF
jgi:hypothetical protein